VLQPSERKRRRHARGLRQFRGNGISWEELRRKRTFVDHGGIVFDFDYIVFGNDRFVFGYHCVIGWRGLDLSQQRDRPGYRRQWDGRIGNVGGWRRRRGLHGLAHPMRQQLRGYDGERPELWRVWHRMSKRSIVLEGHLSLRDGARRVR
jgi:hypothetical protein